MPNVLLFSVEVTDVTASAEEIDGSGNTYVAGVYGAAAFVDVFDTSGHETAHRLVREAQALSAYLVRVNDQKYIVG